MFNENTEDFRELQLLKNGAAYDRMAFSATRAQAFSCNRNCIKNSSASINCNRNALSKYCSNDWKDGPEFFKWIFSLCVQIITFQNCDYTKFSDIVSDRLQHVYQKPQNSHPISVWYGLSPNEVMWSYFFRNENVKRGSNTNHSYFANMRCQNFAIIP